MTGADPTTGLKPRELRLDCLVGRQVVGKDGHAVARLEEVHAEIHGKTCVITEFVLGAVGLSERLGVHVKLLFGPHGGKGYIAKWDQIDLSDPDHPCLTCPIEALQRA